MLELFKLIDQDPDEQMKMSVVAPYIDHRLTQPLGHGIAFQYVAADRAGQIVGAVSAHTPLEWTTSFGQDVNAALRSTLIEIVWLAVAPDARNRGIGRRLLEAAEQQAARQHCHLAEISYKRDDEARLSPYYRAAGYTELDPREPLQILHERNVLTLPYHHNLRVAIKPLRPDVTIVNLAPGGPRVVSGLINLPSQPAPRTFLKS